MSYDNMHRITAKKQHITQKGVQFDGTLNAGYDLAYTYSNEAGKKFQLANVQDLNYRTEETPDKKTENNHAYSYDKNGNLVYVNTAQTKLDGTNEPKVNERKLRWDEENRLLAVDDNGFVSNYWYDAAGERTVKTSGDGEQVYVNSLFSGGRTGTSKFSLYVSPYLVANQGGRYTKHIYVGSQRIVSKLGDLASYGADPRRIPYAGSETDNINVDYKGKYQKQQQVIKDNYATFEVPYNGVDNDNYVDGDGFCCDDKSKTRSLTPGQNDNYERAQFYYHPDHLGSSSFITNLDGDVAQHIEYVPFGEVFIEERNNVWNTPYLFNAKELDEETGLYYYGARYYDPRISLWLSVDPISNFDPFNDQNYLDGQHNGGVFNHYNLNSYSYCYQNPVRLIDPNGKQVDFTLPSNPNQIDLSIWEIYKPEGHKGHTYYWRHKDSGVFLAYDNDNKAGGHYHLYENSKFNRRIGADGVLSGTKTSEGIKLSKGSQRFHLKGGSKLNLSKISSSLGKGLRTFGWFTIISDLIKIGTNHPDAMFSTINPKGNLNTLYGVSQGEIQNLYYEIKSKNDDNSVLEVEFFRDYYYDHDSKRYRGIDSQKSGVLRKNDNNNYIFNESH